MAAKNVPQKKEDYITNKVLVVFSVCLTGVLILMGLRRLLDFGTTFLVGRAVTRALAAIAALCVAGGIACTLREKKRGIDNTYRILTGRNITIVAAAACVILLLVLRYGVPIFKVFYALLPALAVYYLIYHSYQPEFCVISFNGGAAVALLLIVRRALISTNVQYLAWVAVLAAAAMAAVQILYVMRLKANGGKLVFGAYSRRFTFSQNAYNMLLITPVLMAALVLLGVLLGTNAALYTIFAAAGYVFVTAVYYTVKMM